MLKQGTANIDNGSAEYIWDIDNFLRVLNTRLCECLMAVLSMAEHIVLMPRFYGLHYTLGLMLDVWMEGFLADSYIDSWFLSRWSNQYTIDSAKLANWLSQHWYMTFYSHHCIVFSFFVFNIQNSCIFRSSQTYTLQCYSLSHLSYRHYLAILGPSNGTGLEPFQKLWEVCDSFCVRAGFTNYNTS